MSKCVKSKGKVKLVCNNFRILQFLSCVEMFINIVIFDKFMVENKLYPCNTQKDQNLYDEGKLGVASSVDVLMQNIDRGINGSRDYFLEHDLKKVLNDPTIVAGRWNYDMAYLPESGEERLEVTISGSGSFEEMENRAERNLVYKILRRKATHGVGYKVEINPDSVTLSAIPIILTRGM